MKKSLLCLMLFIIVFSRDGIAQNTRIITTVGLTSWNQPTAWTYGHTPLPGEDVLIKLNITGASVPNTGTSELKIDGETININKLTIINESSSFAPNTLQVRGNPASVTVNGNLSISSPGNFANNYCKFVSDGKVTINGNIQLGNTAPSITEGISVFGSDGVVSNFPDFFIYGDMQINPRGTINDLKCTFIFDKLSTTVNPQLIINNTRDLAIFPLDPANPVLFENIRIGKTNATTLKFAGTNHIVYFENRGWVNTTDPTKDLIASITIGNYSTLDIESGYYFNGLPSTTSLPCNLIMKPYSRLRVGGSEETTPANYYALSGSNFPNILDNPIYGVPIGKYSFDPTSTVEYYGNATTNILSPPVTQTIYSMLPISNTGPRYENLLANDLQGSGVGRAQKITKARVYVNKNFDIATKTDVNLGGYGASALGNTAATLTCDVSLNLAVSTTANPHLSANGGGGLYCNGNTVTGLGSLNMGDYSYLGIGHPQGIAQTGNTGNIRMTTRNYNITGNYIFNGLIVPLTNPTGNQITGNTSSPGLPLTVNDLIIDNPTTVTIARNQIVNGICLLKQGIFDIGTTKLTLNSKGKISRTIPPSTTENGTGLIKADAVTFNLPPNTPNNQVPTASATVEMRGDETYMFGFVKQIISGNWFFGNRVATLINANLGGITVAPTPAPSLLISTALNYGVGTNGSPVSNSTIKTNDNLTLLSRAEAVGTSTIEPLTSTGTANFGNATGNFIDGTVSIERYLPKPGPATSKSWRLLAAPVDIATSPSVFNSWQEGTTNFTSTGYGTQITGAASGVDQVIGADATSVRTSMKYYDALTNTDLTIGNTSNPIANKKGYFVFVRGDRSVGNGGILGNTNLRIKGKIRTGNQIFDVLNGKFESVGNPFPSRIDYRSVTKTDVVDAFTVWNANNLGSYNAGEYQTYVKIGADYSRPGSGVGSARIIKNFIESGQAFYIKNNNGPGGVPIGAAPSITIKETDKANGSANAQQRIVPAVDNNILSVEVGLFAYAGGSITPNYTDPLQFYYTDGVIAEYKSDFAACDFCDLLNPGIDNRDVIYGVGSGVTAPKDRLRILHLSSNLLIADRKPFQSTTEIIQLFMSNVRTDYYMLKLTPSFIPNVANDGTYYEAVLIDNFTGSSTALHFATTTLYPFAVSTADASSSNTRFKIVFNKITPLIGVFGGRNSGINTLNTSDVETKVNTTNNATKNVTNQLVSEASMAIVPNLISNGIVNLQLNNQKIGNYKIQIVNQQRQVLKTSTIRISDKNALQSINIGAVVAGTYQAIVIGGDGNKTNVSFIVN